MNENIDLREQTRTPDETKVITVRSRLSYDVTSGTAVSSSIFCDTPVSNSIPHVRVPRYVSTYVAFILPGLGIKSKTVSHRNVSPWISGRATQSTPRSRVGEWRSSGARTMQTRLRSLTAWSGNQSPKGSHRESRQFTSLPMVNSACSLGQLCPDRDRAMSTYLRTTPSRRSPTVVFSSWSSSVLALRPNTKHSANECVETPATRSWASDI